MQYRQGNKGNKRVIAVIKRDNDNNISANGRRRLRRCCQWQGVYCRGDSQTTSGY